MKHTKNRCSVFLYSLALSASTIGGGFVILSVMRRLYVEKLGWLTEDEMLDIASLSQSAPGAVAVNASILLGYRFCGIAGAALSLLGTMLPPMVILSAIAALYHAFRRLAFVGKLMIGMQAGVSAVILDAALTMTKATLRTESSLRLPIFLVSLTVCLFTGIGSAYLILAAALAGVLLCAAGKIRKRGKTQNDPF